MAFPKATQKRKRENSPTQKKGKKQLKTTTETNNKKKNSLDYDSDDTKGLECKIVRKGENVQTGFARQLNQTDGDKIVDEMWVNKYKPKAVARIIGQNGPASPANKLKNWLENWYKNKNVKPAYSGYGYNKSNDNGAGLKCALLSGPPGIGKTTTATLVAQECGFEFTEFNASDTRNKKSMDEQILTLLNNKTMDGFFHDSNNKTKMTSKHVLIMDEVDGMGGNADRGGIAELIQFIKKTQIPIICICNDRNSQKIRNLANYCFDLRFQKPRVEQIKSMMMSICFKEGVKVDPKLLNEIIEMSNHDIRQVIHYFSVFASKTKNLSDVKSHKIIKDVTLGPFDAVKKVFTACPEYDQMKFDQKMSLFFNDYQLMPLFAWENYIQCRPDDSTSDLQTLKRASKSIDAICLADLFETQIRTSQSWHMLPFQAALSTVLPGYYMNGHFGGMIQFPSFLGKMSSTGKKDRLLQELKLHMNLKITGSKSCLKLDYVRPLRDKIVMPLLRDGQAAIDKAISTLNHYCLLKDDLDSIIELSLWSNEKSPFASVDSKVKAAFTRNFNKIACPLPYADKDMIKKVGKDAKGKKGLNLATVEEEDENAGDINMDDDILLDF